MRTVRRLLPLVLILAGLTAAWSFGLPQLVSWQSLAAHQAWLKEQPATHPIAAPVAYVALYALVTALSVPGAGVLTVVGGLVFGPFQGAALAVAGATSGAILLFLGARSTLARPVAQRAGPLLARIRPGLERDGFNYLLAIRLVPIVPFWIVNLAPALAGMRLVPFALATFLGIVPATVVFASIGSGIAGVLAAGEQPDLSAVFSLPVLLPLIGLALLSLLPVLWRRWKRSHGG
jgi:uncharacterized membrane protein YdjX (TVP38/TMEM64 family)